MVLSRNTATTTNSGSILYLFLCLFLAEVGFCFSSKVYVVYTGSRDGHDLDEILLQNHQMLTAIHKGSVEQARASHLYSYRHGFRGFAAKLTEDQASQLAKMPGVVSVFRNNRRRLHTTHSWDFMGLVGEETMEIPGYSTKNQVNVVIGHLLDNATNICEIIGARHYLSGYEAEENSVNTASFRSPRDSSGHGSHTASTASGHYVANMNYKGLAAGGARGGALMARIAVYKTCWNSGCYDVDILAAFDDAIRDGVHVLSLSLGPDSPQGDYFTDAISVGSFHAASHGITVVASVGNGGIQESATNLAPWIITVTASSTDRDFVSDIRLGNGNNIVGESLSLLQMNTSRTIISASDAYAGYFTPYQSSYCLESSLNSTKAKGKVLVCRHVGISTESKLEKSRVVKAAGGVGMILVDEEEERVAIPFVIPAAIVGTTIGNKILSYINRTREPASRIFSAKTVLGSQSAPRVTAFSSKGPNGLTPEILKPDITAPGLNILAAWSPASENMLSNILSGTSMACPHVTGIAALIKTVHPSWSPSAIKSAIMTTANLLDKNGKPITVDPEGRKANAFDYGAGFVNPTRVLDPGLIYDAQPEDYKAFLCSIGYNDKLLQLITGDNSTCDRTFATPTGLNYPSIAVPNLKYKFSLTRTVTNVGDPRSIYVAVVSPPMGINVTVAPERLVFSRYGEKMNFTVNFEVEATSEGYEFGFLTWRSRTTWVTTPLVVRAAPSDHGLLT
ncbi:Subtilisin-like protease SBT5.3 [Camellia lanceoleosa]|uniref:Subtilisin-like protease SBT5.3 n=1 Tax=Camellia lanceoleosa TaxID=1840588 RepID=A0ACC0I0J3_9ERIC|nr:Subtilisin-like protease SBT5.3 [Camellia lanceoleosa]